MDTELMTTEQVAAYLQVPVATLYAWRQRAEGPPAARIGRHLRFRPTDVDAWVTSRAAVSAA